MVLQFSRILAIVALLTAGNLATAADAKASSRSFRMTMVTTGTQEAFGERMVFENEWDVGYTWKTSDPKERVLQFDYITRTAKAGGQSQTLHLSRDKISRTVNGKTTEKKVADFDDSDKAIIKDMFDIPACKLELDAEGREIGRRVLVGQAFGMLMENDAIIGTVIMLHPEPPRERDTWKQSGREPKAPPADGQLIYRKADGKEGLIYTVLGTIKEKPAEPKIGKAVTEGTTSVKGEHTFDAAGEWIAGRLSIDLEMQARNDDEVFQSMKGKMVLTSKALEAPTTKPK